MDESQFRDVLRLMEEHNKAMINCFLESMQRIVNVAVKNKEDHDILIEMNSNLKNHLKNCEVAKKQVQCHIAESVNIRDDVKKNKDFRSSASKALWILYAAVVALIGRIMFWK